MGRDAINLVETSVKWLVGTCLFVVVTPFFMFITWRNCVSKRVLTSKESTGFLKTKKVYDNRYTDPIHSTYTAVYGLCYLIFMVVTCLMMFAFN